MYAPSRTLLRACFLGTSLLGLAADFTYALSVTIDRRQTEGSGSSTNGSTSRKAGLAWPNADSVDMKQFTATGKVTWYYTWSVWPVATGGGLQKTTNVDLEWVPMLWGNRTAGEFSSKIGDALKTAVGDGTGQVKAVLGMNEPEQPGQSNMTPEQGVEMWLQYMEPLRAMGLRLGSPAVSSGPNGKLWMQDFFKACNGRCSVDFIAMHWYGVNPDAFIAHLYDYYHTFNTTYPLWITEWACHNFVDSSSPCTSSNITDFLAKTQGFMDDTPWVERYSYFGAMKDLQGVNPVNALMDGKGVISSLGRQYIGASDGQPLDNGAGVTVSKGCLGSVLELWGFVCLFALLAGW
ncbi:hypothetical protein D9611_008976 [Ephemerocybe angulata]|uniref:Asl1-like glycosyl hydrolase catalytic domain-containing protein n=1 Tax=Ephemerocybe angulata TaxID=980116 RepID=A0A8H5C0L1_9AGAR|nr:hypothetical protein D9611_008976 [Tulosesus angulatus]